VSKTQTKTIVANLRATYTDFPLVLIAADRLENQAENIVRLNKLADLFHSEYPAEYKHCLNLMTAFGLNLPKSVTPEIIPEDMLI